MVLHDLTTAEQRLEQLSILALLKLYVENVPIEELENLKNGKNVQIVDKLAELMINPTLVVRLLGLKFNFFF